MCLPLTCVIGAFVLGDEAASFTKEEMQQGKHTDYERLLHEQLFICQNNKEGRCVYLSVAALNTYL